VAVVVAVALVAELAVGAAVEMVAAAVDAEVASRWDLAATVYVPIVARGFRIHRECHVSTRSARIVGPR